MDLDACGRQLDSQNREPTGVRSAAERFNQLSLTEQRAVPGQFIHRAGDQRIPRVIFIAGISGEKPGGADPQAGSIAVGRCALGQTIQFQRRDAEAATEDMAGCW